MPGAPSLCPSYASALVGLNAVDALARRFHSECVPLTAIFPAAGSPSTRFTRLWRPGLRASMRPRRRCSLPASWRETKARFCGASGAAISSHRLAAVGLHPDRVIYAETHREAEVLAAAEEGLRHKGLAGVVAEVARLGLTASRRLQLAAEESGVPALILRRWRNACERASDAEATAAVTRWQVSAAPSRPLPVPGIGRERWLVELIRCKGAEPRSWLLESPDAKGRLALPSDVVDGSLSEEHGRRAAA